MDGQRFREWIEDDKHTELARLGSERLPQSLTDGEPTRRQLLQAAANSEHAARETFRQWIDDETDSGAQAAFAEVADQEHTHRQRALDALGGTYEPVDGGTLHTYLRSREGTTERIATGMVARPLVSCQTHRRLIAFFEQVDDPATVELFEDLLAETEAVLETGLSLLEVRCVDGGAWERPRLVAEYTIQVAYDEYTDGLRAKGLDPER